MREWTANHFARTDHGTYDKNNKQFALGARGARVISIRLRFNALSHKSFSPPDKINVCIFQEQSIRRVDMHTSCTTKYNAYRVSNFRQIAHQYVQKFLRENEKFFFPQRTSLTSVSKTRILQRIS